MFDFDAFREAWVNACLHNDYSTHLGLAVYLFSDHLEIFSYGSPLKVQSKESFLKGISKPINPELATIFMKLGDAEESGKGINTIVRKYGKEIFNYSDTSFVIDIPYNNVHREEVDVHRDEQNDHRENDNDHRDVHPDNGHVHREEVDVHRIKDDVHRDVHRDEQNDHRENDNDHRDVHPDNCHVHREDEDVHRETQPINKDKEKNDEIIEVFNENQEPEKSDIKKIIKLINDNKNITLKEMSIAINKSVKSVQRIIREYGKIKYQGKFNKGYWEIID